MPMRDSRMTDDWISKIVAANPPQQLANGNWLSGPVRLAFVSLLQPYVNKSEPDKEPKFTATLLFPPQASALVTERLWPPVYEAMAKAFPNNIHPQTRQPFGLHSPFRDQAEKPNLAGYNAGALFVTATSKFKPPVVDASMNPIVDQARVYSGVWAFVAMNLFDYGQNPPRPKKGVSFGLQSVMIIADDTKLGGQGADPQKDFGGVTVDAKYDPAGAFGGMMPAGQPVSAAPPPMAGGAPMMPGMAAPSYAPPAEAEPDLDDML